VVKNGGWSLQGQVEAKGFAELSHDVCRNTSDRGPNSLNSD
jgi:hypothetical protein